MSGPPGREPLHGVDELELDRAGRRFVSDDVERTYVVWRFERSILPRLTTVRASAAIWINAFVILTLTGYRGVAALAAAVMSPLLVVAYLALRRRSLRGVAVSMFVANAAAGLLIVVIGFGFVSPALHAAMLAAVVAASFYRFGGSHESLWVSGLSVGVYVVAAVGVLGMRVVRGDLSLTVGGFEIWLVMASFGLAILMARGAEANRRLAFRQEQIIERQKQTIARERAKTETALEREVAHQVAERSRELGAVLAQSHVALDARALAPGERFAERYRVIGLLGAGGMGAVYEVVRITDERRLALKAISGAVLPSSAARFAREAEIGARIQHPNLISIVDVGVSSGTPFLAMDLVTGGPLEAQRGKFGDAGWALPILRQIAQGLAALHEAGVVHRDLKPANVLLDDGVARITDFGISRFDSSAEAEADPIGPTRQQPISPAPALTASGVMLGTPIYMAPEALDGGRHVGPPADVFAFGVLACELFTGRAPFAAPPMYLAAAGPLPKPALGNELASSLRDLFSDCLAVDPDQRPEIGVIVRVLANEVAALDVGATA